MTCLETGPQCFTENMNFYGEKFRTIYCGWVLMPDHYHILMYLILRLRLANFERDFKSMIARRMIDSLLAQQEWHKLLHFKHPVKSHGGRNPVSYRFWQNEDHVVPIGDLSEARIKLNYIHDNPVRAGLVGKAEDWPHSSARWYSAGEGPIKRMMRVEEFFGKWYGWQGPRGEQGSP